jgi:hypothetical protein
VAVIGLTKGASDRGASDRGVIFSAVAVGFMR